MRKWEPRAKWPNPSIENRKINAGAIQKKPTVKSLKSG
jgi:hypothetical protein